MEELMQRANELQDMENSRPVIDISYVELPEQPTCRASLSSILGGVSFLSIILVPAAVEGESYIIAVALMAACGICAKLAIREEGKKR